jgi:CheY-like chemotaxis protein
VKCSLPKETTRTPDDDPSGIATYSRAGEDRQRSLLAGYQMHLSKPVEARELIAAIASLLHLKR